MSSPAVYRPLRARTVACLLVSPGVENLPLSRPRCARDREPVCTLIVPGGGRPAAISPWFCRRFALVLCLVCRSHRETLAVWSVCAAWSDVPYRAVQYHAFGLIPFQHDAVTSDSPTRDLPTRVDLPYHRALSRPACNSTRPSARSTAKSYRVLLICPLLTVTVIAFRWGRRVNSSLYRVAGGCGLEHTINSHGHSTRLVTCRPSEVVINFTLIPSPSCLTQMSDSRPWWERGAVPPPRDSASRPSSIPAPSLDGSPSPTCVALTPRRTPSNERARSRRGTAAGNSDSPGAGPRGARGGASATSHRPPPPDPTPPPHR